MKFSLALLCLVLFSCSSNTSKTKEKIREYYPTYTKELEDTVRTLELSYVSWFCQCANWATETDIELGQSEGETLGDKVVFIEPATTDLELADTIGYSGDLIRFTGQFYKDKGYPKKYPKTEMEVSKAKVFRYTKYHVLQSGYRNFVPDTALFPRQ